MTNKLTDVFDQIHAEETLKDHTKVFLQKKTKGYTKSNRTNYRYILSTAACLLLLLFGGYWIYFTPVVEISIDINPSIELSVNRFDKVISVTSYNDDGTEFIQSLDIKYLDYTQAVDQILNHETITALLSNDEVMAIGIIGPDGEQSSRMLSELESCTAETKNTYCYRANSEELNRAHELGLSYGKYSAFLTLQSLDPDITADEVRNMTMREIRDLIANLSANHETDVQTNSNSYTQHESYGHGYGYGNGYGKRK